MTPNYTIKKLTYGPTITGPGMSPTRSFGDDRITLETATELLERSYEQGRRDAFTEAGVGFELEQGGVLFGATARMTQKEATDG
jgi:hypothetical protein